LLSVFEKSVRVVYVGDLKRCVKDQSKS